MSSVSYNATWLRSACAQHVAMADMGNLISGEELASQVIALLTTSQGSDALQGDLFELLGVAYDGTFDFMLLLLSHRQEICADIERERETEAQVRMHARHARAQQQARQTPQHSQANAVLPQQRRSNVLPRGTTRKWVNHYSPLDEEGKIDRRRRREADDQGEDDGKHRGAKYEEVNVPPPPMPSRAIIASELRGVTESLSPIALKAFTGIEKLNRMQSKVYESAYKSNSNLLVCAPTGAGKTNVAMLTIAREIERHADAATGEIDVANLLIIYIAPMKALAQEVVQKFGKRLKALKLAVRECTGDMQLSRADIEKTQLIVTTPEKWDVITRKAGETGNGIVDRVGLIVIDEVHIVGEDRGPVIECLVARTLRLVESRQKMVRIVGLSATLPNYMDVAHFLRVDQDRGLFFFDNSYRPVPLEQSFIGVQENNEHRRKQVYNEIAYSKVVGNLFKGEQVIVFVHSRKDTVKTARAIVECAAAQGTLEAFSALFQGKQKAASKFEQKVSRAKSSELKELFAKGLGCHHAGMHRSDRTLTEQLFAAGAIQAVLHSYVSVGSQFAGPRCRRQRHAGV